MRGKQVKTIDAADPAQVDDAIRLLNEHCKDAHTPLCTYKATKQEVMSAARDDWLLYGQPYGNCATEHGARYELEVKKTLEWSDSIKTSVKAGFDIEVVKGGVEVEYQHKITASYEVSQTYEMEVPFQKVGGFFIQPGYLEITGDFQLYGNDATYLIKNATIQLPLGQEYKPQGRDLVIEPAIIHGMVLGDDKDCVTGATSNFKSLAPGSAPPADAVDLGPAQEVN